MEKETKKNIISANKYIPITKIVELRKKGLNYQEIADVCKCSKANIYNRLREFEYFTDFQNDKALEYEILQCKIIKTISDDDIKKTPFVQRITSIAILEDKIRLVRGQSTQNVSVFANVIQNSTSDLLQKPDTVDITPNTAET